MQETENLKKAKQLNKDYIKLVNTATSFRVQTPDGEEWKELKRKMDELNPLLTTWERTEAYRHLELLHLYQTKF